MKQCCFTCVFYNIDTLKCIIDLKKLTIPEWIEKIVNDPEIVGIFLNISMRARSKSDGIKCKCYKVLEHLEYLKRKGINQ